MLIFLSIDFVLLILYGFYSITRTETYMYTHLAVYCTLTCACACVCVSIEAGSGHLGHPGPTRFANYSGLTRIGSREKRNCSFDDVETYKC